MCISERKCAPWMICQPFTVVYSGIRGCKSIAVAKVSGSQLHHKLAEVHRVASHNLTSHQIQVCQTIQRRQEMSWHFMVWERLGRYVTDDRTSTTWKGPMYLGWSFGVEVL
eukprot:1154177-Pelagomonas_calceolata.AAC.2